MTRKYVEEQCGVSLRFDRKTEHVVDADDLITLIKQTHEMKPPTSENDNAGVLDNEREKNKEKKDAVVANYLSIDQAQVGEYGVTVGSTDSADKEIQSMMHDSRQATEKSLLHVKENIKTVDAMLAMIGGTGDDQKENDIRVTTGGYDEKENDLSVATATDVSVTTGGDDQGMPDLSHLASYDDEIDEMWDIE